MMPAVLTNAGDTEVWGPSRSDGEGSHLWKFIGLAKSWLRKLVLQVWDDLVAIILHSEIGY